MDSERQSGSDREHAMHLDLPKWAGVLFLSLTLATFLGMFWVETTPSRPLAPVAAQPPPTWTPGPPPTKTPLPSSGSQQAIGGMVELRAQFPKYWPWDSVHWHDLWTVVQWQDQWGWWRTVEGWQGEIDRVSVDADGRIVGIKTWWVGEAQLGAGPFRWSVYLDPSGPLLARSEAFYLPAAGEMVEVKAALWLP